MLARASACPESGLLHSPPVLQGGPSVRAVGCVLNRTILINTSCFQYPVHFSPQFLQGNNFVCWLCFHSVLGGRPRDLVDCRQAYTTELCNSSWGMMIAFCIEVLKQREAELTTWQQRGLPGLPTCAVRCTRSLHLREANVSRGLCVH